MKIRRGTRRNNLNSPPKQNIPHEVPYREVEHDEEDFGLDGFDCIIGMGYVRDSGEYWQTQTYWKKQFAEIKRREKRREEIGGFGFRIERAS